MKIDTQGRIISSYDPKRAEFKHEMLEIVSAEDHTTVLLTIDEVSDEDTFNAFLKIPPQAQMVTCLQIHEPDNPDPMTHEILMDRGPV